MALARALLSTTDPWFELRNDMPAQYIRTFLMVAAEEGLGVGDYARKAGVAKSVMSRHVLDLGDFNRKREPGFELLEQHVDIMERRRHAIYLTPKGRALLERMKRAHDLLYKPR